MTPDRLHRLVVVPHTHWDREWYRTHEQFRYRLVRLLDGLLDLLERDPEFRHFTLDGQVIVVDDYLEVRPEARKRIEDLVRSGRLLIGPWYVLPDEWLVSGEALIRNLRLGLARAAAFGGAMELGYVPDQFGHVGQLPQLFAGFGFDTAVLWRGVGADVDETLFRWQAPDGTTLTTVYLMRGYGNASNLPMDPTGLAERLRTESAALGPRSPVPSLLLMNGSDHLEPQAALPGALRAAFAQLRESGAEVESVEIGTLPEFASLATAECASDLTLHVGELRSGLRSPLLPGCASARLPQKRAEFDNDRLLTRYLEPLAAWLQVLGGDPDCAVIDLAWKVALENHPHDSVCGCSIDAVHDQMDARFARVREIAESHLERVSADLGARVQVASVGAAPSERPESLIVWNPGASGVAAVEGEVELEAPGNARRPALHLRDASGAVVAADAERLEVGTTLADYALAATGVAAIVRGFPAEFMGQHVASLDVTRRRGRLEVEARFGTPQAGFDFDAAKASVVASLAAEGEKEARFRAARRGRFRLRFVDSLPGAGLRVYRVCRGRAPGASSLLAEPEADAVVFGNAVWRVRVDPRGVVDLHHLPTDTRLSDAVRIVSEGDRGDEYNFDPVVGDASHVERPHTARVRLLPAAATTAGARIDWTFRVPRELSGDRQRRSTRHVVLPVSLELRVHEGLDRIDVAVSADNTARDHRLRVLLRGPADADRFEVESAFEVVERPIDPPADAFGSERPAERPIGATPQRAFATLSGSESALTVANRGSAEVEAVRAVDGETALAVTLLRAIGWLSRDDLQLRPGHAGPPLATPGAQVPGRNRADLSLRWHRPDELDVAARAHHFVQAPLLFRGGCRDGRVTDGARLVAVDDPAVHLTAVEPTREGVCSVRLVNLSSESREAEVLLAGSPQVVERVDLAGRSLGPLREAAAGGHRLPLGPWEIATLRPALRSR